MNLLSIDVGTKNLSFCMFCVDAATGKSTIVDWQRVDLCTTVAPLQCCGQTRGRPPCKKAAKYVAPDDPMQGFCQVHGKQAAAATPYLMPDDRYKAGAINAMKIADLREFAQSLGLTTAGALKPALTAAVKTAIKSRLLVLVPKISGTKIPLATIGTNIQTIFSRLFANTPSIDICLIENQIGPKAVRMKSVQTMAVNWLAERYPTAQMRNTSSANKLKAYVDDGAELSYREKKAKAVEVCSRLLDEVAEYAPWAETMRGKVKHDDLADCFLQGIWYIGQFCA